MARRGETRPVTEDPIAQGARLPGRILFNDNYLAVKYQFPATASRSRSTPTAGSENASRNPTSLNPLVNWSRPTSNALFGSRTEGGGDTADAPMTYTFP